MRRHRATRHRPVLLSVQAGERLAALQEGPPREPPSERSAAMPGTVRQLAPLWAALPAPPVGAPNVRLAIATDCATENFVKDARMKLIWTTTCAMVRSISLSAAQTPSASGGNTATTPPAASPSPDPIAPAGHWNVAQAGCRAILSESDDDRAVIGMFYYGYLAAKLNLNIIDTSRIEGDLRHVFETCRDHPDMTIVAAFRTLRQNSHSR
jgi:hypothetical protein